MTKEIIKHGTEYKEVKTFRCYTCACEFKTDEYFIDRYTKRESTECPACSSTDVEVFI